MPAVRLSLALWLHKAVVAIRHADLEDLRWKVFDVEGQSKKSAMYSGNSKKTVQILDYAEMELGNNKKGLTLGLAFGSEAQQRIRSVLVSS
ncbi:hypothetical protein L2E82_13443 [Cichorium intybus]|uniref:Uncharacterized protein n=1 Tax=Cichorium intybus TaxID=13427 RepID=A0ACB9EX46_CICIN|nr:hypothetical protein L2E82_13443 [Cichorium intybus]